MAADHYFSMIGAYVLAGGVSAIAFAVAVYLGFWMGRHTAEKPMPQIIKPEKQTQPLFEEDPYADAARRREKSEGSL